MKRWSLSAALLLLAAPVMAAESAAGQSNIFAGGIGNALITLVIFGTVVWALGKYAWPHLLSSLNERERTIREALEAARRDREESARVLSQYQQQIDRARLEATAIVEESRRDAVEVRRRIQEEARSEANAMVDRAKREIRLQTDAAIKELYDRTADLAVDVARSIIGRELRPEDHRALVSESLERMRTSQN